MIEATSRQVEDMKEKVATAHKFIRYQTDWLITDV